MKSGRLLIGVLLVSLCGALLLAALPASDNFNRANETPLAGNWTAPDGVADSKFNLTSNHLEGQAAATLNWMYWNADAFNTNHKSQATLGGTTPTDANTYGGVAVRIQSSGQSGYLFGTVAGVYKLQRLDAGTRSNLQNCTGTPTAGDVLRLEANGSTFSAYVNNTLNCTASGDSTYSGGAAGLFGYSTLDRLELDDWSGGNLGAVAAKPKLTLLGVGDQESR